VIEQPEIMWRSPWLVAVSWTVGLGCRFPHIFSHLSIQQISEQHTSRYKLCKCNQAVNRLRPTHRQCAFQGKAQQVNRQREQSEERDSGQCEETEKTPATTRIKWTAGNEKPECQQKAIENSFADWKLRRIWAGDNAKERSDAESECKECRQLNLLRYLLKLSDSRVFFLFGRGVHMRSSLTNKVSYSHRGEMGDRDLSRTTARRVRKQQAWRSDRTTRDHVTKPVAGGC